MATSVEEPAFGGLFHVPTVPMLCDEKHRCYNGHLFKSGDHKRVMDAIAADMFGDDLFAQNRII
jgi:hypothetical protein